MRIATRRASCPPIRRAGGEGLLVPRKCLPGREKRQRARRGVAAFDYVLVLCVILPLMAFIMWVGPRIMNLAYQMVTMLVTWPFM